MAFSTAYASKKLILADLEAEAAGTLANVGIFQGEPNWQNPLRDNVYVGELDDTLDWAQLGAQRQDEISTLILTIEVFRPGTAAADAEDRWWAIANAIEDILSSNITLGNTVIAAHIVRFRQALDASSDGYRATGTASIEIHARF